MNMKQTRKQNSGGEMSFVSTVTADTYLLLLVSLTRNLTFSIISKLKAVWHLAIRRRMGNTSSGNTVATQKQVYTSEFSPLPSAYYRTDVGAQIYFSQ